MNAISKLTALLFGLATVLSYFGCKLKPFPDDLDSEHFSFYHHTYQKWSPMDIMGVGRPLGQYEYVYREELKGRTRVLICFDELRYLYYWEDNPPKVGVSYKIPESDVLFLGVEEEVSRYVETRKHMYCIPYQGEFKFRTLHRDPHPPYRLTIGLEGEAKVALIRTNEYGRQDSSLSANFYGKLHHTQDFSLPHQPLYYLEEMYKHYPHLVDSVIRQK